ncbi:MAG TPA: hypothetical protein VNM34_14885 [Verrucomicrobiae bacterium]|nr:hypothetical protein [Verrucomicrobiae bacterium]
MLPRTAPTWYETTSSIFYLPPAFVASHPAVAEWFAAQGYEVGDDPGMFLYFECPWGGASDVRSLCGLSDDKYDTPTPDFAQFPGFCFAHECGAICETGADCLVFDGTEGAQCDGDNWRQPLMTCGLDGEPLPGERERVAEYCHVARRVADLIGAGGAT